MGADVERIHAHASLTPDTDFDTVELACEKSCGAEIIRLQQHIQPISRNHRS